MIYCLVEEGHGPASTGGLVIQPGPEGFVHCCDERQIPEVRKAYFHPDAHVRAVVIDPTRLGAETRYEPGSGGEGERFAHVYGPIDTSAVTDVIAVAAHGRE